MRTKSGSSRTPSKKSSSNKSLASRYSPSLNSDTPRTNRGSAAISTAAIVAGQQAALCHHRSSMITLHAPPVRVEGTWFMMGSDDGPDNERPIHRVWVDTFELGAWPGTPGE